ncbi:type IV pilin [Halorientalis salina]|uniref:type IV pilin n=1 Tax=Halorientalis salina TaxID=2932266 RepID=UPI0010AC7CCC|nr:type IV pilin N-terminal domain-containing protein [Halorientalis salina]
MPAIATDRRAVSPVVGAVLLVAISVTLAGVGAIMVFGLADDPEPAPDVALELETADSEVLPEYELVHESGDTLNGENVEIRGVTNESALSGEFRAGQTVDLLPTADEIRIVWMGDDGTSYTLATFDVEGSDVPSIDEGCAWVDSETNGGTDDIQIDGQVVDCSVRTDKVIEIENGGVVIGDTRSDTKELDADDAVVYGSVDVENVLNHQNGRISGTATSRTADVKLYNVTVGGGVEAQRIVDVLDGSTVDGDVESTNKEVTVDESTVSGSITAPDQVKLIDSTVEGDVYVDPADFDCTNSEINGQDCGSYTPRDPSGW